MAFWLAASERVALRRMLLLHAGRGGAGAGGPGAAGGLECLASVRGDLWLRRRTRRDPGRRRDPCRGAAGASHKGPGVVQDKNKIQGSRRCPGQKQNQDGVSFLQSARLKGGGLQEKDAMEYLNAVCQTDI